jgi:hypothetical protein
MMSTSYFDSESISPLCWRYWVDCSCARGDLVLELRELLVVALARWFAGPSRRSCCCSAYTSATAFAIFAAVAASGSA